MQKYRILQLAVLIAILSTLRLVAQPGLNATKVDRNVVFGMYSGLALLMDVYYPENPNGYGVIQENVLAEVSILFTAYNLRRSLSILGFEGLLERLRALFCKFWSNLQLGVMDLAHVFYGTFDYSKLYDDPC